MLTTRICGKPNIFFYLSIQIKVIYESHFKNDGQLKRISQTATLSVQDSLSVKSRLHKINLVNFCSPRCSGPYCFINDKPYNTSSTKSLQSLCF